MVMVNVMLLLLLEFLVVFLEFGQKFHLGVKWLFCNGIFVRSRLPISSSAGERLHHGNGVERYVKRAMCGSSDI